MRLPLAVGLGVVALLLVVPKLWPDGDDKPKGPRPTAVATVPPKLGGPNAPLVLAHRGGSEEFAWQTLPAFIDAAKAGAAIETDVRWTSDGVPILVHDENTTPGMECEGGNYVVAETPWPTLRDRCLSPAAASKDGKRYPIPTFTEGASALAKLPGAQLFAEVKVDQTDTQVRQFMGVLENVRMVDRTVVTADEIPELTKIQARAAKDGVSVRTLLFVSKRQAAPATIVGAGIWGVAVESDIASADYLRTLKAAGLKVCVYTINSVTAWAQATDAGVDLVLTDKPHAFGTWAAKNL